MQIYKKGEATITRSVAFLGVLLMVIWAGKEFGKWLLQFEVFQPVVFGSEQLELPYYAQAARIGVLGAIALTVIAGYFIYRFLNAPRMGALLIDTEGEFKRVNWPTWNDARQSTGIVMVFVVFVTAYLTGVEWILKRIFDLLWNLVT